MEGELFRALSEHQGQLHSQLAAEVGREILQGKSLLEQLKEL
jgi:hypothetical protein